MTQDALVRGGSPEKQSVRSVCPYCGVGCGLVLETEAGRIVDVKGDPRHPANFGRLCTKGKTSFEVVHHSSRLTRAYIRSRRSEPLKAIDFHAAIRKTAEQLLRLLDEYGPDALAFYVSGQISLEAQYLANKLAKGYIQTNQIESNSRLCMASTGAGYKLSLGADGPPGSYQDIDRADLFFVIGSNMADCHPVLFRRLMDRKKKGARLIVVDPRRTATANRADLFLQIQPGTDLALINGILHLLQKGNQLDYDFIENHTEGWETLRELIKDYPPEKVAELTRLSEDDLKTAALWIGQTSNWISCWTMGLNQSTQGTFNVNGICNLHLATGAICRPGAGPLSLTGQPNAMGGREMGYMGIGLPGQRSADSESDRRFVEGVWGLSAGTLSDAFKGGAVSMFESMASGAIKACWIIGTNPAASLPDRTKVLRGLENAELVIVQDVFKDTETTPYADILLPGAIWAEAEGVMINSERNLTLMQKAVEPPGDALPDWLIIAQVAKEMGFGQAFDFHSAADVFEEIKHFHNPLTGYDLRGASYPRLSRNPLQWPCPPDDNEDRHPIRYLSRGDPPNDKRTPIAFPTPSGKARFWPRKHLGSAERPCQDYPFILNTGRLPHQWHTLTKTGKVPLLNRLNPAPFVAIHPDDGRRLFIQDGDEVEIVSRRSAITLPAKLDPQVLPGNCWVPFHWNECFSPWRAVNALTHNQSDPISREPEFKASTVRLMKL